ncbi:MAG: hypothetical protein ABWZ40_10705 [Caulobacterales bacterium]
MARGKGNIDPGLQSLLIEEGVRRKRKHAGSQKAGGGTMGLMSLFPLLTIPVIVYNLMTFLGSNPELTFAQRLSTELWSVPMASGATWTMTPGDVLVLIALVLLFVELIKSTHTGQAAIINHGLSLILFIVCLIEFLLIKSFATSVFFAIMMMTLLDTLAGVIVTITSARRDFSVSDE